MNFQEPALSSKPERIPRKAMRSIVTVEIDPPAQRETAIQDFKKAIEEMRKKHNFSSTVSKGRNPSQLKLTFVFSERGLTEAEDLTDEIMNTLRNKMQDAFSRGSNLLLPA